MRKLLTSTLLIACTFSGAHAQMERDRLAATHPGPEDPATLPLLGDDQIHLYVQEAYEGFAPDITAAVEGRFTELVGAGMDTARHLFDWADLEPEPGVYDTQLVIDAMQYRASLGIEHQFCNLVVIDSEGTTVPPYVEDLLDSDAPWDDPQILQGFRGVLDVFVPLMLDRDMFMLGLSNEPSGYYEDTPLPAASFVGFIDDAVRHAHSLEPELACTVVFAGPADAAIGDLMPLLDVASFNDYFYVPVTEPTCLFGGTIPLPLFLSSGPGLVGTQLDELIAVAQGKLICIQEIGQATGWNDIPATLGPLAGLENQRACYESLRIELDARRDHFRTVCNWVLNDHTMPGMQWIVDALDAGGLPSCYSANVAEIFGPAGLVRSNPTASTKPAFFEFKNAVSFFAAP